MTHPPASTKLLPRWSSKSFKVEFFSVVLVLLPIGGFLSPVLTQARLAEINCQSGHSPCSDDIRTQLQIVLNQPVLFSNWADQLESNDLSSSFQVSAISIKLPKTLNITLTDQAPQYLLITSNQVRAVFADGHTTIWSDSELPSHVRQIWVEENSSQPSQAGFDPDQNTQLHSQLLNFLTFLSSSEINYEKLELLDASSLKVWLTSQKSVLLDLNHPNALQKLTTILHHPDFLNSSQTEYNLDLRFQYPLLLKSD